MRYIIVSLDLKVLLMWVHQRIFKKAVFSACFALIAIDDEFIKNYM